MSLRFIVFGLLDLAWGGWRRRFTPSPDGEKERMWMVPRLPGWEVRCFTIAVQISESLRRTVVEKRGIPRRGMEIKAYR